MIRVTLAKEQIVMLLMTGLCRRMDIPCMHWSVPTCEVVIISVLGSFCPLWSLIVE